jgi:hypothetical protein
LVNAMPVTDRLTLSLLAVCTAILVVIALYLASASFAPLAFGLFVLALVWPMQ